MKLSPTINLLATLACVVSAEILNGEDASHQNLQPRQAKDIVLDATAAPTQAPAVTTIYMQVSVGTTVTYAPIVVTQTFAKVPDQWPSPASGAIGYGTLTQNHRREAEPSDAAGIADRILRP
ncbi:uncharacterized protein RCC_04793 [Ramularia collo-cygni]|uniref:Uncharacterized protein n=1 Tax=Ramularia collo-cygni TaxID=112498 RepID=A0A2D3UUR1_9PEZI|nr:uncharacterized protein RCC_04793 [Ramularia collo-cygni]CZT18948.1 uncharacterized protein RCC_04793 [Ramularia collo-cygni]